MASLASLARRLGRRPWFLRLARALVPVDELLGRLSHGRLVLFGLHQPPALMITTTGRRSRRPRTHPLVYAPDGDDFVVIGSNWGRPEHPAWSTNLLANPDATVMVRGADIAVRARLVTGAERQRLRGLLCEVWPNYPLYEQRSGRELRIFRLQRRD